MPDSAKLYLFAWKHAHKIPEPLLRGAFNLGADFVWWRRGRGVRRLEANYAKVRPDLDHKGIRRLSRKGMRSYLRYFREAFTMQAATQKQVCARVRVEGLEYATSVVDHGKGAVLALGHLGNWDLAGAFATPNIAPVLAVAEKLKPERLYDEFVNYRRSIGIEVLGLGDDGVFEGLVKGAKDGPRIICLLADRDLTSSGIEVDLANHRARVAAGPAAVALAADVELLPLMVRYERLTGARRKVARTPWGIVLTFYPPIPRPDDVDMTDKDSKRAATVQMTQGWVDAMGDFLTKYTEDWHMLQRVFVSDLDPSRYQP